ncbi:MAG: GGDEF domain-containing protein [Candidatus Melainabacteria bacterium]|nr:GGDEF domain-containing protein [Candidatus Melainabacteria bacterium]
MSNEALTIRVYGWQPTEATPSLTQVLQPWLQKDLLQPDGSQPQTPFLQITPHWEELLGWLADGQATVVLLPGDPSQLANWATQLRTINSVSALIAVTEASQVAAIALLKISELDIMLDTASTEEQQLRIEQAQCLAQAHARAERFSQLDEMSGLYNRRHFVRRTAEELSLSRRHGSPVSVAVVALDQYRLILDSYGFEAACQYLRHVGKIFYEHSRQEDTPARIADNELALLLPRSSEQGAAIMVQRLLQTLRERPFGWEGQQEWIGTHAGLVCFPLPEDGEANPDRLIRYAQHALHLAHCDKADDDSRDTLCLFSEIRPSL